MAKHYKVEDFIGKEFKYGLIVLGLDKEYLKEHPTANRWIFKCTCGNTFSYVPGRVADGEKRSCGCKVEPSKFKDKHGYSINKFYQIWKTMQNRCYNEKDSHYKRYGARGITVCEEWKNDVSKFVEWAERTCPKEGKYSVDRIDNNGQYSPENCRWATDKQQCRNTRRNRNLEYNGETKCIQEWSEIVGISAGTIRVRLDLGWPIERALTEPVNKKFSRKKLDTNSTKD